MRYGYIIAFYSYAHLKFTMLFHTTILKNTVFTSFSLRNQGKVSCPIPYNVDAVAGTSRYLNRNTGSPLAKTDDPPFWASQGIYKNAQSSGQLIDSSDGNLNNNKHECFISLPPFITTS